MNIEKQMMLACIEHEKLKALDAFGMWYKIVADFRIENSKQLPCAEEEFEKVAGVLRFWMEKELEIKTERERNVL